MHPLTAICARFVQVVKGLVSLLLTWSVLQAFAVAEPVTAGLAASFSFNETTGSIASDSVGNHHATVYGNYAWEAGALHHVAASDTEYGWTSIPRGSLLSADWTVGLWFSAKNNGEHSAGRVVSATTRIGGTGPEWFFRSGKIAMRINNTGASWNEPLVGSRSNDAPPDHWALPTKSIQFNTLYHYVVTHTAATRTVKIYQARADTPSLELVFHGTYSGSYAVSVADIRLSRSHNDSNAPRYVDSHYAQLRIYERALTESELAQNHAAGPEGDKTAPEAPSHLRFKE